jgi:hypothetical protein
MDFNWISNGSNEPWTSVSINSTGQNAVACMTPPSNASNPNFLYYYNTINSEWNSSTINNPPQTDLVADEHQLSMSNSNSFVAVRIDPSYSYFSYYYSSNNGVNYDVVITGSGGEIPNSSSINSNGYLLSTPTTTGYPFVGTKSSMSELYIFEGQKSFGALSDTSDTNYGFICAVDISASMLEFYYSDNILNESNWSKKSDLFGSFTTTFDFTGISCSSSGQYIIVGTNTGIFVSSNGTAYPNPPTFTEVVTTSNVSGVAVSKSGQYGLYCQNTGAIYYSNDYLQNWVNCTDQSLSTSHWSSVSISDEYNYNVYAVASVNKGSIYNATIPIGSPPPPTPPPTPNSNPNLIITTIPNPIIAAQPATIIYQSSTYLPIPNNNYVLKNSLDVTVSSVFSAKNSDSFTFTKVYLMAGLNVLYVYNLTTASMSPTFNVEVSAVCFRQGTKILCRNGYLPIEQLDETVYVKTNKHGYKKVKYLIKTKMINSSKKTINKLYVMKKTEKNGLIEDLFVTGSHALLKDQLSEKEEKRMDLLLSNFKDVNYERMIDDKQKVLACFDKRFEEYNEEGYFNIYHIVLEDENNKTYKNYGIYANGILAESTMEKTLSKLNNFDLINVDKSNISIDVHLPRNIKNKYIKSTH